MVHQRYIKRGGKVYGPYLYKSIRTEDGKVINIYLGHGKKKKGSLGLLGVLLFILLAILLFNGFAAKEISVDINAGTFYTTNNGNSKYDISIANGKNSIQISDISATRVKARFFD